MKTIFHTEKGPLLKTDNRMGAAQRAIKKAAQLGAEMLTAKEGERIYNYSFSLKRYYEDKSPKPVA